MSKVDWNQVVAETHETPRTVSPRRRLIVCFLLFGLFAGTILARAAWLEVANGPARRAQAAQPRKTRQVLTAKRGKIVDRNGIVLAEDRASKALAVRYRYLETPPNPRWLRSIARSRLSKNERKDAQRIKREEQQICNELQAARERLAELCGLEVEEWDRRAGRIQHKVERISRAVNLRRMEKFRERQQQRAENPPSRFEQFISPEVEQKPEPIIVREELDYHVIVETIPPEVVEQLEAQPDQFPGIKIVERTRRTYPLGTTASHLLGYLGKEESSGTKQKQDEQARALVGKTGLERLFEESLHARPGEQIEATDHSGRLLAIETLREAQDGQTVKLTIDTRLQQTVETLLDRAIQRRSYTGATPKHVGGAAVVMDAQTGELLTVASSPRFDPNWFVPGAEDRSNKINQAMTGPSKPMFNRATQMAIPPGSVFKIVTAVAGLESGVIDPTAIYRCRGFMEDENAYRCQIYLRHKEGHGPIQLADALAQSCNTYFFNVADQIGAEPILAWAVRFGLGQKTRAELSGESSGELPPMIPMHDRPELSPINARFVAIGQERLRTTPLQIARMMAVITNGGRLLQPRLVINSEVDQKNQSTRIPQLHPETLAAVRRGLEATVTSPQGTAHDLSTLDNEEHEDSHATLPQIAGKTGTAQVGAGRSDHAWFAAYAPASNPRYVVVVALEHAGSGSESAVPVARRIFAKMQQLGLF
ncbi:MAG: penicillin-binding transpeptidase domain-containing protein [Planctomycetia bacterium]